MTEMIIKASARHKARRFALQALYQWLIAGTEPSVIEVQFLEREQALHKADLDYFRELLHEIPKIKDEIDQYFMPFLDRKISQVSPIELTILRLGSYEMAKRPDVPFRVVINEAVELAKMFGAEGSHKYINSILDKAAQELRQDEFASRRKRFAKPSGDE